MIERRERRDSKQHTQIQSKDFTVNQLPVAKSSEKPCLTLAEMADFEERDRKRPDILDRDYLRFLENQAKNRGDAR